MTGPVGIAGIGGVVAASAAIDAAGIAMQAVETASSVVTAAVIPPSADPGSATAAVQMGLATADMKAKSVMAFAGVEALGAFLKSQALAHAGANVAGTAAMAAI
ncbi:hypothetical protein [Gordonia sihwensis]|uniref:hypothetical protein n=1 Tax=Gordonia sihwensis TaxID=173559 RepID=UPI003D96662E